MKFAGAKNNSYHFFFELSVILLGTIQWSWCTGFWLVPLQQIGTKTLWGSINRYNDNFIHIKILKTRCFSLLWWYKSWRILRMLSVVPPSRAIPLIFLAAQERVCSISPKSMSHIFNLTQRNIQEKQNYKKTSWKGKLEDVPMTFP